jgi:hypothetical protein
MVPRKNAIEMAVPAHTIRESRSSRYRRTLIVVVRSGCVNASAIHSTAGYAGKKAIVCWELAPAVRS